MRLPISLHCITICYLLTFWRYSLGLLVENLRFRRFSVHPVSFEAHTVGVPWDMTVGVPWNMTVGLNKQETMGYTVAKTT